MKYIEVVGAIILKDGKLLIDKPRRRPTYQMVGGRIEVGETRDEAIIRECIEELGLKVTINPNAFHFVMDFIEIATSDPSKKIHMHIFKYDDELVGELTLSDEIEAFMWFGINDDRSILSNTLKNEIIPYCIDNNLIF